MAASKGMVRRPQQPISVSYRSKYGPRCQRAQKLEPRQTRGRFPSFQCWALVTQSNTANLWAEMHSIPTNTCPENAQGTWNLCLTGDLSGGGIPTILSTCLSDPQNHDVALLLSTSCGPRSLARPIIAHTPHSKFFHQLDFVRIPQIHMDRVPGFPLCGAVLQPLCVFLVVVKVRAPHVKKILQ
jgi:hypothetical protein